MVPPNRTVSYSFKFSVMPNHTGKNQWGKKECMYCGPFVSNLLP